MASESLKLKGNEYFAKGNYEDAIKCYSEALTLQPENYLALSNRSASYIKLNLFQNAYDDAVQCIAIAPNFARGYLRKATALVGLQQYEEALQPAEKGYCLRGSDQISKGCIAQWLIASKALLTEDVATLQENIPGIFPLTKNSFEIFREIEKDDKNSPFETLEGHLLKVTAEFKSILKRFGHSLSPCMCEWIEMLTQYLKLDPRTHAAVPTTVRSFHNKSNQLVMWLRTDVDHLLYPVVQPTIFGPLILSILCCISTLNQMISSRSHIQIITKACLIFFDDSILSTKEYVRVHIHLLQNLLNSFCMEIGHNKSRAEEAPEVKRNIEKLTHLFSQYDSSHEDYAEVKESTELVIENARLLVSKEQEQLSKRLTNDDAGMLKSNVNMEIEELTSRMDSLHFRDMDSLVLATGGLISVGEIECAKTALKKSEEFYSAIITKLLKHKILGLNDAAESFFHPQTMMLCNAIFFAGIDDTLLANMFIRWKCLSTELYALLARVGISGSLFNLFKKLEDMKVNEDKGNDGAIVELANQHTKEVANIVEKFGGKAIDVLLGQSWEEIQKRIQPKQMLLQYCMSPLYDTNCHPVPIPPKVLSNAGVVIAIMVDGPPIIKILDFGRIQELALESHNKAMKAVNAKCAGKPWKELHADADKAASNLLNIMLPNDIQSLVSSAAVECIYFCPDQVLAKFPIEILPFSDGERLGEKVGIAYLSSARELLRESAFALIAQEPVIKKQPTIKCKIFSNPNFDLEKKGHQSSSHWGLVGSLLSSFFSIEEGIKKAHSLPGSENEAYDIQQLISDDSNISCPVDVAVGDDATLYNVLQVDSPLVLHLATHGFSNPDFHYQYHNFWCDTKHGLLLAGANTYRLQKYGAIHSSAGTGELTALAACGMKLDGTHLVYLSTCRSSYGFIGRGETLSSLAQGFRIAGSRTVIATLWPVTDEVGHKMALLFYMFAKEGMCPSLALQAAKKKLHEEGGYEHWYDWAGFLCIGIDLPIFDL